jgi:hypothetical protein
LSGKVSISWLDDFWSNERIERFLGRAAFHRHFSEIKFVVLPRYRCLSGSRVCNVFSIVRLSEMREKNGDGNVSMVQMAQLITKCIKHGPHGAIRFSILLLFCISNGGQ